MKELMKRLIYRNSLMKKSFWPKYPYKISPGQLSTLLGLIDATEGEGSAVMEIGVARGDTSVFLLEHLRNSDSHRPVFFLDTFSGFTDESIEVEIQRGKPRKALKIFRYGNKDIFSRSLHAAGYSDFTVVEGDAAKFDYSKAAPIGVVLLDIDVYLPTLSCLHEIWPHLSDSGGIVVDDCLPNSLWDGSLQAVEEFCADVGVEPTRVGGKGLLIRKR